MFFFSMNTKRLAFSEPFLSHRRKVFSGFSLGVAASLLILSLFFLSNSLLKVPKVEVFLPGFETVGANSSFSSCLFNSNHSSSYGNNVSDTLGSVDVSRTGEVNVPQNGYMKAMQEGMRLENNTLLVNSTENGNNASLHGGEQGYAQKTDEKNGALVTDKGNLFDPNGEGLVSRKTGVENSSRIAKDVDLHDGGRRVAANTSLSGEGKNIGTHKTIEGESRKNSSFSPNLWSENNNVSNLSYNGKPGVEGKHDGDLIEKNNVIVIHSDSQKEKMRVGLYENCDTFDGKWIRDDSKPYYPLGSCPLIDRDFDCHLNGRPDGEYLKWKWRPNGCDIPRYDYGFSLTAMKCS